ncbi:iron chelate uptake ABC transporter family permease subunit [Paralimibaculum aggregatum]|uniref:Iron chelate uptake ABC transporter family permease subunit n=1 Tax=Paralimibaculum aggregatum TaxID=3036245 RepID=A0ABQ6LSJ0_9RHOB|nr:iron chelate uptake ABC transporter family permease subunit [Limibaculum sp. NKW23]GMG85036.1 iron chelate uptake ABC transporter family permease subunit [Limibaculum sp. NKW23]
MPTAEPRAGRHAALALAGLALLAGASLFVGAAPLSASALLADGEGARMLMLSRLPRTLACLLTGAAMAIAGLVMQMLARNRFVEPSTVGSAQGAALGLLAVTLVWPAAGLAAKMLAASLASLAGTAAFLAMVRRLPVTQPLLVPLAGLAWGAILGAAATFIAWETDLMQFLEIWLNGEFSGVVQGRYEILWLTGIFAAAAYLLADRFTIAGLGRDAAVGLGLRYERVLLLGLLIVAAVTALTVVTVGMIPFVGLVVPNLVRMGAGDNIRAALPLVALAGAGAVLAADLVGRLVIHPFEVPAATVFGVIGAGVFVWLIVTRRGHGA